MPSAKPAFFFSATQSVADRIGEMFGFLWANYTGLRELCWQVRGFRHVFPSLAVRDMEKKFLAGLPMPGGIDLLKVCVETGWEQHEREFAKWLLFEACALYEGWAEKVCADIFISFLAERNAKNLQFPGSVKPNRSPGGYLAAVGDANTSTSQLVVTEFFPTLKSGKLNRWSTVNDHLIAYRFFKECRNAIIHSDGRATQDVIDWHAKLAASQAATPSPFRHPFAITTPALGARVVLDLRDCTLLATVVHRLICTFDAALCVSSSSELILEERLRRVISNNPKWKSLPNDSTKRAQRIHRLMAAARIPEPQNLTSVMTWMKTKGLI